MQCDQCLHVTNTAAKTFTPTNSVSRFPPIQEWATALPFLYMPSCRVTAKTLYKTHKFAAVANGYLESILSGQGGPGIIALPSFLYIQSCRVTAFGISLYRISLTNLPLCSMVGISLTNLLLLPYKYTPTCDKMLSCNCKTSSMQPSPHPTCKPSTSA
jgi:hypothetical protein